MDAASAKANAAYGTLTDKIIEAWSDSQLKEFCDKNAINGKSSIVLGYFINLTNVSKSLKALRQMSCVPLFASTEPSSWVILYRAPPPAHLALPLARPETSSQRPPTTLAWLPRRLSTQRLTLGLIAD